ncbi:MAG: cbb3-type cytochrome oxidase assembly protein CcoS [Flavobacteriaceae bacterium]|nr:cbb3-type cytochrome oxidase assembly protein CcoS [Flavobacteriaceae bacterium]
MNIIYMLLAISVFVALIFFALFIYSVKKGQYDDTYTPSVRMLFEDELVKEDASRKNKTSNKTVTKPETEPVIAQE